MTRNSLMDQSIIDKPLSKNNLMICPPFLLRIRRAGYPIRHTFKEFIDRYRMLVMGVKPSHMEDCKAASTKICKAHLGTQDWQLGHHKVFLKDAHDLHLEQERDKALTARCIIIQKVFRGWFYRRKFLLMRKSVTVIAKAWRKYAQRIRYLKMKRGYQRLQAVLRGRVLTYRYQFMRKRLLRFQASFRLGLLITKGWFVVHAKRMAVTFKLCCFPLSLGSSSQKRL